MPRPGNPRALLVCVAAVAAMFAGCGKGDGALVPVTGRVLINGKPAAGAAVVFHPAGQAAHGTHPLAQVDENGEFRLTTVKTGDGATPGEYRVTLTWYVSTPGKRAVEGDDGPVRNLIPDKYAKAGTTPLSATVSATGTDPVLIDIKVPAPRR